MNFVPGIVAATAYESGEVSPHGGQRTRAEEEALNATPEMYNRVLKQMKEEVEEDIEKDEKKLKKEGKKIAHLQEKLDKEERKYIDMKEDLCEGEEVETALEYEKLRKAEKELKKLQKGHDDSPVIEKVEEFIDDVKGGAKKVLGNVAEFAHLMFADEREIKLRERAIERGDVIDGENAEWDEYENKTEKKLREAARRIEELKLNLAGKRNEMFEEDDEQLKKEAQRVADLQQELAEEEAKYTQIEAALAEELQYEARIREEARKLKELQINA